MSFGAPPASSRRSCRHAWKPRWRAPSARTRAASAVASTASSSRRRAGRGDRTGRERPAGRADGPRGGSRGARRPGERRTDVAARRPAGGAPGARRTASRGGRPLQVTVAREQAEQAAADAGATGCAYAQASKTPWRLPRRACAPTRPDTHSSHARVDPSRTPPASWRHAGPSTGKRRDHRAHGGRCRARGRAHPGRGPPRASARVGRRKGARGHHSIGHAHGTRPRRPRAGTPRRRDER